MKFRIFALLVSFAVLFSSCENTPMVKAKFTVDKSNVQIKDEINVTNLSVAENTIIGLCKWEWDGHVSYEFEPTGVSFAETGEYTITLTVYAEQNSAPSDTYKLNVSVFNSNKAPVAKFEVPEYIEQGTPVKFIDASTDETGYIVDWQWKFGNQITSVEQNPTVTFNTYGETLVTLTVVDNYGASATVSQTVYVEQSQASKNNKMPTPDFIVPGNIIQYMPTKFIDNSTDEDGTVVDWHWTVDGKEYTGNEASLVFSKVGLVDVVLSVTDDLGGTAEITRSVEVKPTYGHEMKLDWSQTYDTRGHVYWTSPAVSTDGSCIYVSSTGYNLVCFDPSGNIKGSYDIGEAGANPYSKESINNQSPTPSIDKDGNVIIPVQFYENPTTVTTGNGGVFSIRPECAGLNWYFSTGVKSSYRFLAAPVFGDYIAICLRETDYSLLSENAAILNRNTGTVVQALTCDQGSYGGMAVSANGDVIYGAARSNAGYKVAVRNGASWTTSANTDAGRLTNFMNNMGDTKGSQPAISSDGYVYLCVSTGNSTQMACSCYSLSSYSSGTRPTPIWTTIVETITYQCGHGVVLDKEGNPYFLGGDKIFRLNKEDGSIAWEVQLEKSNVGVAAIDSNDFIYVCESYGHRLIKIASQTGEILSELPLVNPRSCPTIGPDGSIYITGNKNNMPVLYKVSGTGECKSTAPGENWSQLGANPQKNGCAPGSNF